MIIGAGEAGRSLVNEFHTSAYVKSQVVCAIDDNPVKRGKRLLGVPIVGDRYDIPNAVKDYKVDRIIFAIPTAMYVSPVLPFTAVYLWGHIQSF